MAARRASFIVVGRTSHSGSYQGPCWSTIAYSGQAEGPLLLAGSSRSWNIQQLTDATVDGCHC
jgi:hypothetical protein